MEFLYITAAIGLIGYLLYSILRHEKSRGIELNYHLMQAKRILNSKETKDKLMRFIDRFQEAEDHIKAAQSCCTKPIEFSTIANIREELDNFKKNYSN